MKITIYELLGMVKDGKAPKTIKSEGHYYKYNELEKDYYEGMGYDYEYLLANTAVKGLDDKIEIIEDKPKEEKKIPEKIKVKDYDKCIHDVTHKEKEFSLDIRELQIRYNDLLEYLESKGE